MASHFNVSRVCWVPFWAVIIVLHNTRGVEVVYEWGGGLVASVGLVLYRVVENRVGEVFTRVKVFVDFLYFRDEEGSLTVGVPIGAESSDKGLGVC